ncbi:hypothetical protein WR25_26471 [Diploscapter pachys]|uniref:Uncharacterized protein n=1 Tax=Diploscapter pachys TaxID=2018661 RepID=A0A2A2JDP2_9BILA|nr:hypothetical protein WR25_26471 [Diploscapter pachys]
MNKLTRAWSRLSTRRPTLPTAAEIPDFDDDDEPTTKAEVFQMFAKSPSSGNRRRSQQHAHTHSVGSSQGQSSSGTNGRRASSPKRNKRDKRTSESSVEVPAHISHSNTLPHEMQRHPYEYSHDKSAPNLQQTSLYDPYYHDGSTTSSMAHSIDGYPYGSRNIMVSKRSL